VVKFGLMVLLTGLGVAGGLAYAPFAPAAIYHFFAVLRPQFIWGDSLEAYLPAEFPWSMILALAAIAAALVSRISVWVAPHRFPGLVLPRPNIGHALMLVFAVWITASYLNADYPEVSEPFYADYRKIFIMFFVTSLVMVTVRQAGVLYLLVALALVYIAYEVNEIYLLNGRYNFLYRRGFAGLDNNGAALLLAMGVPLCVYAWDGLRHWVRWAFPVGALLIVHAVLLSYSRGAMLALVVTAPLYLFRCQNKKLILAGYLAAAMLLPFLASEQIAARFFTIKEADRDASAQNRFTTWDIAWQMANERPLFGYGVRNSNKYTHKYGADEEGRTIHSTYLQIAADSGLVGLATYVAFLGGAFYCAFRVCKKARGQLLADPDNGDARLAHTCAAGAEGALAVFVVGGAFLSLETFEPPYIIAMLAIQLWSIVQTPAPVAASASSPEAPTT
jgi:probable O-glycosylation ligase (exosortase A-associated)